MANQNHLEVIKQGAKVWHEWRKRDWQLEIDLTEADLRGFDLAEANLTKTNFRKANLTGANLRGANLAEADLTRANLDNADLTGVDFNGAILVGVDLRKANPRKAKLNGANLGLANLSEVDLSGIDLSGIDFTGANLGGANLRRSYLYRANLAEVTLVGAYLSEAYLMKADLRGASLGGARLRGARLGGANLTGARLTRANLSGANLTEANFTGANLSGANLTKANLYRANLTGANLSEANLAEADLGEANLAKADLQRAILIEVNLEQSILKGCQIYGLSVWNLKGRPHDQSNLVITKQGEPVITVDDLQIAQFIYLLLNNKNVRNVLDTITSKAVLILGRFTPERKIVLDAVANELRKNNLLPIIFDFDRPVDRDFTETIKILAGLSLFIIADITNPKSSPLELQATIPDYQIPFVTIIQQNEKPFSMFSDLQGKYDWVLPVIEYDSVDSLIRGFEGAILKRAWSKHQELQLKKANEVKILSIKDFIKENGN